MAVTHGIYRNNRIIPCPFLVLSKSYIRSDDGTVLSTIYNGTLTGTLVAYKGSPNSSGVYHNGAGDYPADETLTTNQMLTALIRKQEYLRELFSEDGLLEIQGADGMQPMKMTIRVGELSFEEGLWNPIVKWTLNFTCDTVSVNGVITPEDVINYYIQSAQESWEIETLEDQLEQAGQPIYRVSHSVSAQGIAHRDETATLVMPAWQQAEGFVLSRLGYDSAIIDRQGVINASGLLQYNHVRSKSIGELDGNCTVTETFLLASGVATEDFEIETRNDINSPLVSVSINGTINGLEIRNSSMGLLTTKYDNAQTKFNSISGVLLTRAQNAAGVSLNINPTSSSIGRNQLAGVIRYSYEYDTRPSNLINGTRSESIQIADSLRTDVIAIVGVLQRYPGPVLQPIGTTRELSRTLSMELVMTASNSGTISERINNSPINNPVTSGQIQEIIDAANPANAMSASQSYLVENTDNFDVTGNRYSLNKTWIYER